MKNTKTIMLAFAVCLLVSSFGPYAFAIDNEKKQVIKELLDVSGAGKIATIMSDATSKQILGMLSKQNPDTPKEVFQAIDEEIKQLFEEEIASGSFYELIYPIYDEKFTTDELKEVLTFYKTPVGQKVTKELPEITQKAMVAGQQWGLSLSPKIQSRVKKRLEAEGLNKN